MDPSDRLSDEELLSASCVDDAAFAAFYRRYERPVLGYFVRAVGRGEVAADLTAEVFAELVGRLTDSILRLARQRDGCSGSRATFLAAAVGVGGWRIAHVDDWGCR